MAECDACWGEIHFTTECLDDDCDCCGYTRQNTRDLDDSAGDGA